ncbi:MAG: sensor histidine kinase [Steroidobacter sp.]
MAVEPVLGNTAPLTIRDDRPLAIGRAIFFLWAVFWALMILIAVQDQLHDDSILWWEPLLWEGSSALGATFWLVMQWRVARRYEKYLDQPLRWFAHHLKWMPLIAVTFIVGVYAARHGVYGLLDKRYVHEPWPFLLVYESAKLVLFAGLWLGILFGFSSFAKWRHERQQLLMLQKSLAEAQLSQLKAQLRPHFLFNALNTISSLMHSDVERADRLLARLSDLLRSTLQTGDQDVATLREELHVLELYARIMQERFPDRVTIEWRIDPAVLNASVPALLLQPLLENAFKHGVEKSREHVLIEIRGARRDDHLHLAVRNSGALPRDRSDGVGIRNCQERLRVMYGEAASLELSEVDGFVVAEVAIPLREQLA